MPDYTAGTVSGSNFLAGLFADSFQPASATPIGRLAQRDSTCGRCRDGRTIDSVPTLDGKCSDLTLSAKYSRGDFCAESRTEDHKPG